MHGVNKNTNYEQMFPVNTMLEIIEEGLQLKLEIQDIKDQFQNLVHDFEDYEQEANHHVLKSPTMSSNCDNGVVNKPVGPKMSAARARVKALYEARKARIRSRRSSASVDVHRQLDLLLPPSKVPKLESDDDKENICKPPTDCRNIIKANFHSNSDRITSTPLGSTTPTPLHTMTWSIRKFLSHDKEQHDQSSVNIRCLPKNLLTPKSNSLFRRSSCKSREKSHVMSHDDFRDKISNYSVKPQTDYNTTSSKPVSRPHSKTVQNRPEEHHVGTEKIKWAARAGSMKSLYKVARRSVARDEREEILSTSRNYILDSSDNYPDSGDPFKAADTIREVNDISQISLISRCDFHEQVSSANISGAFHSTFNYPLHSTLNYPLHSTFSMTSDSLSKDILTRDSIDATTTVSEPVTSASHRKSCQHDDVPLFSLPRQTLDDSCVDYDAFVSKMSAKSGHLQEEFSPSNYKTQSKKPQVQLCKEHGIHPTFDGSCIFQNGDTLTVNSSDDEVGQDENGNTPKVTSNIRETDCDSSYLSECLDDHQSSIDVDEYAAMYDTTVSCLKILKRQTGQVELKDVKERVGLSESDLHCDTTRRSTSMEATCASLPDNDELSALEASMLEEDRSESTLHASSLLKGHPEVIHEIDTIVGDETLVSIDQRPVSLSTNEDSPESNTAMPVPVNSPNITDSGGSSSRQNTDNYDYMEMQPQQVDANSDKISLPGSHTTHSSTSVHSHRAKSSQSHYSHHSSRSHKLYTQSCRVPQQHHQRQYASTPSQLHINSKKNIRSPRKRQANKTGEHRRNSNRNRHHQHYDWDSGCSSHSSRSQSKHFTINDNTGRQRTIIPDVKSPENLSQNRKHLLAKRLKVFSNSFYKAPSANHLQIQTLGHF
ncbi:hypothetical protein LSH36_12g11012 [Paralvinella palmiformis]|uniref:Uncharacterized protein n=1 Tax=Paralvinella palmiformis TaxID=53620 RepID=A0AAD9KE58_9ANNE|nr:hypothetical protein LSH36_12g11012 [Paralvinella palmiformis]